MLTAGDNLPGFRWRIIPDEPSTPLRFTGAADTFGAGTYTITAGQETLECDVEGDDVVTGAWTAAETGRIQHRQWRLRLNGAVKMGGPFLSAKTAAQLADQTVEVTVADEVTITVEAAGTGVALGETSTTAYRGDRGKIAYDHSQTTTGNPHSVTKAQVGLGSVDNTADADKPISTATAAALATKATLASNTFLGTQTTRRDLSTDPAAPTVIEEYQDADQRPVYRVQGVALEFGDDPLPIVAGAWVEYDLNGAATGKTAQIAYGPSSEDSSFGFAVTLQDDESITDVPVRVGFPETGDTRDAVPRATYDALLARVVALEEAPSSSAPSNTTVTKTVNNVYGAPSGTTSSTAALNSSTTAFFIWTPPWDGQIDRLYVEVTTAGTGGSTGRLGVWAVDPATNLPTGTPLDVCPSTVAIDANATVSAALSSALAVTKGTALAFALQASANTTFRAISNYRPAGSASSSILGNSSVRQALSYATGMAGQTAAAAGDTSNQSIVIAARVSA